MPPEARAKQFMPFAALGGLEEALSKKERREQPKPALDEEEIQKIDRMLNRLAVGDATKLVYFYEGSYVPVSGDVTFIDPRRQTLYVGDTRVPFEDILKFG